MRRLLLVGLAVLLSVSTTSAFAQSWPSRPIKFVISFGPGSASDAVARILAKNLTASLGQPVVVVSKPGADGTISGIEVQRSAPDGYTFLFGTNSALAVAPNLRKAPPYNVLTDFTPVAFVGLNTLFFTVNPELPITTMQELVAYARANPGKFNAATGHTYAIVATALFAKQNNLDLESIPYKSEPDAIVDLLANRVQMMVATSTPIYGLAQQKKLRVLAGTTGERNPLWPDIPTMVEAGQPQHPFEAFFAIVGPVGLPSEIRGRMNDAVTAALGNPEVREQLQKQGFLGRAMSLDAATAYIKDQNEIWKAALEEAHVEPQ